MASDAMNEIKALMRDARKAGAGPAPTIEEQRAGFEATLAALPPVVGGVVEDLGAGGAGGVPAEWMRLESGTPNGTLLYLHGGGYFQGSPASHRRLVTSLCVASGLESLNVDYRLAPEHPFPAAVEDALAAYRWLISPAGGDEDPDRIIVAGDSAGGGLSTALLVALRDAGDPLPAGAHLISPWTDLAATGGSMVTRAEADPFIDPAQTGGVGSRYAGSAGVLHPLVSPLYADLTGLPPLLIHVGDSEVLLDDSTRLADRAIAAGVPVELQVWDGGFHVFQMMAGMIPEADEAIAQAGAWMAKQIGAF